MSAAIGGHAKELFEGLSRNGSYKIKNQLKFRVKWKSQQNLCLLRQWV